MKRIAALVVVAVLLAPLAASPALAKRGHGGDRHHGYYYSGHQGRWHHGWHGNRHGWWWVVGPSWTYYPYYPAYHHPRVYYPAPAYRPVYQPVYVAPPTGAVFSFNFR